MSDIYAPTIAHPNAPVASQQKVVKTLTSSAAEQLTPTRFQYKAATFFGVKPGTASGSGAANSADVYLGFDSSHQPIKLASNTSLSIAAGADGWPNDLSKIWVKGTSGDGVVVTFQGGIEI